MAHENRTPILAAKLVATTANLVEIEHKLSAYEIRWYKGRSGRIPPV
jgi:hypothetical protein